MNTYILRRQEFCMYLASPPPITMDTLPARIAHLTDLPMDSLWGLWDAYFDTRPKRRNRKRLEGCLSQEIQKVAIAEYQMEECVTRKLSRWALKGGHRRRHLADRVLHMPQPSESFMAMTEMPLDINGLIDCYLTLFPDLTRPEALWLVGRAPHGWPSKITEALADVLARSRAGRS